MKSKRTAEVRRRRSDKLTAGRPDSKIPRCWLHIESSFQLSIKSQNVVYKDISFVRSTSFSLFHNQSHLHNSAPQFSPRCSPHCIYTSLSSLVHAHSKHSSGCPWCYWCKNQLDKGGDIRYLQYAFVRAPLCRRKKHPSIIPQLTRN